MAQLKRPYSQTIANTGSFETHIEIPVTVHYEFQLAERQTRHYPGCPAAVCINTIEYEGKELPGKLQEDFEDQLEQECWDDLEEGG